MRNPKIIVTGSAGLIGSECCIKYSELGFNIISVDNNYRKVFFGQDADTKWRLKQLKESIPNFDHHDVDIRDNTRVIDIIKRTQPDILVHAAAQPSHSEESIHNDNYGINTTGTYNILEALRLYKSDCIFVYISTNKVYGDNPNTLDLVELENRYDFANDIDKRGISESCSVDNCHHTIFGASKLAADILVQEYARTYGMTTCCLRAGCLTGSTHSGVRQHGFLNYLVRCNLKRINYNILGYKGKQVRDNLHSSDLANLIIKYTKNPTSGEVYNIGGGLNNSCSILEAINICEGITGIDQIYNYTEHHRAGDHICYYTDLSKVNKHYPSWSIKFDLKSIFNEIIVNVAN